MWEKCLEIFLAEGEEFISSFDTLQIKQCFPDNMLDLLPQIDEDIKTLNDDLEHKEQAAKISISRKFLVYDDDDDEYYIQTQEYLKKFSSAITPDLPITDSLIMEDEKLDTIPVTESANTIKSSVEDLVNTSSEFVNLSDGESECDIPSGIDSNDDSEGDILPLEELLDNVLSPFPESDDFTIDVEPVAAMTNDFDVLNNDEPFDPGGGENVVFLNVEEDDSFTFTIRTFLPFVTYPEASPLSCSTGSEDTIFDPGIST
ncbi:hypothetical protein Tco_1320020 [Tanacetum coccineum]